jgi:hypothetical protein
MSIKYVNIFPYKALKNLPQLGFFSLKTNHLATLKSRTYKNTGANTPTSKFTTRSMKIEKMFFEKNLAQLLFHRAGLSLIR